MVRNHVSRFIRKRQEVGIRRMFALKSRLGLFCRRGGGGGGGDVNLVLIIMTCVCLK